MTSASSTQWLFISPRNASFPPPAKLRSKTAFYITPNELSEGFESLERRLKKLQRLTDNCDKTNKLMVSDKSFEKNTRTALFDDLKLMSDRGSQMLKALADGRSENAAVPGGPGAAGTAEGPEGSDQSGGTTSTPAGGSTAHLFQLLSADQKKEAVQAFLDCSEKLPSKQPFEGKQLGAYEQEVNEIWRQASKSAAMRTTKLLELVGTGDFSDAAKLAPSRPTDAEISKAGMKYPKPVKGKNDEGKDAVKPEPEALDRFYRLGCVVRDGLAGNIVSNVVAGASNEERLKALSLAQRIVQGTPVSEAEAPTGEWKALLGGEKVQAWATTIQEAKGACQNFTDCYEKANEAWEKLKAAVQE